MRTSRSCLLRACLATLPALLITAPVASAASNWAFNLPTTFAPLASGGLATGFEGGVLGPEMATTAVDAATLLDDPDALSAIGTGVLSVLPFEGTYDFEMGLATAAHSWHAVRNALVIGLDGAGHPGPFVLDLALYNHGDSNDLVDGVWLSTDGVTWHHVSGVDGQGNAGLGWADWADGDNQWGSVSFDLAQTAAANGLSLGANFYVAIAEEGKLPIGFFDGIAIDSISIDASVWLGLGGGLAGSSGVPSLDGSGDLTSGSTVTLSLGSASPLSSAALVIGLNQIDSPFFGGTLVPSPDIVALGIPVDGTGAIVFNVAWPGGVASGTTFYLQYWIMDPAAPFGYSASNGLSGTVP